VSDPTPLSDEWFSLLATGWKQSERLPQTPNPAMASLFREVAAAALDWAACQCESRVIANQEHRGFADVEVEGDSRGARVCRDVIWRKVQEIRALDVSATP